MALDYDGTNTGIFYRLGRAVKVCDDMAAQATTTLPAQLKSIADPFESADLTDQIAGLYASVEGLRSAVTGNRQLIAAVSDAILTDRITVLNELGISSNTLATVLPSLFAKMQADSKTIKRNTVTLGSVTAASGNVGNGTVLVSKILDGYSAPGRRNIACTKYAGVNSEIAVPETMRFKCIQDSYRDRITAGQEVFAWSGARAGVPFDYLGEGSGDGPTIAVGDARNLVTGGTFENFASDVPSGWTVAAGTAGTHIFQNTTSGQFYRGSSALKLTGDGVETDIGLIQYLSSMNARRGYFLTARVKASAVPTNGDLVIYVSGVGGFTPPGGTASIAVPAASLTTGWVFYSTFFVAPANITTPYVSIEVSDTLDNAKSIFVDDVMLLEATYHGGIAAAVVPGVTPFAVDDAFTVSVANDDAGKFQRFFRQKYGFQLPSASSPAISESLVA